MSFPSFSLISPNSLNFFSKFKLWQHRSLLGLGPYIRSYICHYGLQCCCRPFGSGKILFGIILPLPNSFEASNPERKTGIERNRWFFEELSWKRKRNIYIYIYSTSICCRENNCPLNYRNNPGIVRLVELTVNIEIVFQQLIERLLL